MFDSHGASFNFIFKLFMANYLFLPMAVFAYSHMIQDKDNLFILTHWGRDEMDVISQTTFSMHFIEWKCMNYY